MRVRHFGLLAALILSHPAAAQDSLPPADSVPPLQLLFLDVGQGDAAILRSPEGYTVLVDAGPSARRVIPWLEWLEVDTIDLAVASHPHADHIGGMRDVLARFAVRFYMDNGVSHTTVTYRRLMAALAASDVTYLEPVARSITAGSATIHVLPPPARGSLNDRSVGLIIEYGKFRALLTGDAEYAGLQHFLETGVPRVTVLKAAHHGARNGVTPAWIAATRPEVVVVSVGARNAFGHPDPMALRYYAALGATVYRTDISGSIRILGRPDGRFELETERGYR